MASDKGLTRGMLWASILCLNALSAYYRLMDGIPMGEDSSSHLYKVLYAYENYRECGAIPAWSDLWYGGHPFLLFYPPLSYWLTLALALLGTGPILAYKLLDAAFYIVTPIAVYLLAREVNLGRDEGLVASLLYSLTPIVMENYLFFDRFPTVMSIPIVCTFLVYLSRSLKGGRTRDVCILTLLSAMILLTHHLSAYCAAIAAAIFTLSHYLHRRDAMRMAKPALFAPLGSLLISSFWLFPFLSSMGYQEANPFINFNLLYNYTELLRLGYLVLLLGAAQFFLAIMRIREAFFSRPKGMLGAIGRGLAVLFVLGASSGTYGTISGSEPLTIAGQACVAISLGILLIILISAEIRGTGSYLTRAIAIWFMSFLWLGLGKHAFLVQALPFWEKLDSMRFLLYASIPQAILAGEYVTGLIRRGIDVPRMTKRAISIKLTATILCAAITTSLILGGVSANLNNLTPNTDIPPEIVEYFKENPVEARILPIGCPKWVYLLPTYTKKPIIDGWFPQGKVLKPLLMIRDYRINDLMDYPPEERDRIWQDLIRKHARLGINWIMIGKEEFRHLVEGNADFKLALKIGPIEVYEATRQVSLIEARPPDAIDNIKVTRLRADEILIDISGLESETELTIKQAYMPYWKVSSSDGLSVEVKEDEYGYLTLLIPPTSNAEVKMRFSYVDGVWLYLLSAAAALVISLLIIRDLWKERKGRPLV